MIPISSHPETMDQLLLRSFRLYYATFRNVFLFALTLSIIAFIPRLIALTTGQEIFINHGIFSPERLSLALIDISCLIIFSAILWRIRCLVIGTHETIFDDLKTALRKLPYILVASVLQVLSCYIFIFLFIVFMFYVSLHQVSLILVDTNTVLAATLLLFANLIWVAYIFFAFYFYLPIILIENQGILAALSKSVKLVWKNWWRTALVQVTPWLIYLLVLITIKFLLNVNIHIYFAEPSQSTLASTSLHMILFALFVPLFANTILVQLRDLELPATASPRYKRYDK